MTANAHYRNALIILPLTLLAVFGLWAYKDFGIASDEPWLRELSIVSLNYVAEALNAPALYTQTAVTLPHLKDYADGDHGVVFEIFVLAIEKILKIDNERELYQLKHLITFLASLGGVVAIYLLAKRRFGDWRYGLLAAAMLVASPRIFGESFYNSKDIIFMACFAMALNSTISFALKKTATSTILHSLITAIAFDMRIAGVVIPAITVFILLVQGVKQPADVRKNCIYGLSYLVLAAGLSVLVWPWLWLDIAGNLKQAFINMAHFQRLIIWILFRGHYYVSDDLPWYYIPIYISITTPVVYLAFFGIGLIKISTQILMCNLRFWRTDEEMQDFLFINVFVFPIIIAILLKSVLYSGWRHFYFIYPCLILIAVAGFRFLLNFKKNRIIQAAFIGILLGNMLFNATWIVKAHPLSNVYFNILAGRSWWSKYEVDYWGMATYHSLKYILAHDQRELITIKPLQCINLDVSLKLLTKEERDRVRVLRDDASADYMLLNYIFMSPEQAQVWKKISSDYTVFHNIKVDGEPVISILKEDIPLVKNVVNGAALSYCP